MAAFPAMSRIVILTEGRSNPTDAKTATGVIRYRTDEVVAILDSAYAGRQAEEVLGVGGAIPFVGSLGEVEADTLLIGIAPAGGGLPPAWRATISEALRRGMNLVSGLHFFLADDPEFRELAARHGAKIHDVRRPPPGITVSRNLARHAACFRVHTIGHDCSVGKMLAAIEITAALKRRGRRAEFVATGQTGIMISGWGVPIDAVVSDFVAGAIESLVLEHEDQEFLLIEGQGSLIHPLYSGVTLGLLHGCAPQAMVMVYDPTRTDVRHCDMPMPPLEEVIEIYERLANVIAPSRVVALAVNASKLTAAEADAEVRRARERYGLPAADVLRHGSEAIVEAVLAARAGEKAAVGAP
jgi:uncharacterized NAD-dependent epimerase/dehydratase family protein